MADSFSNTPSDEAGLFGPYQKLETLGGHRKSQVLKCRHNDTGEFIALKLVDKVPNGDQQNRERLESEFTLLSHLERRCPAAKVPKSLNRDGIGETSTVYFLSMSYIEGISLESELRHGRRFSVEEAKQIIADLAKTLHYVHLAGIVHLDIKPSNILLTPENGAYLIDFGTAQFTDEIEAEGLVELAGTPPFLSPEQSRCELRHNPELSDVYSLGAVLYLLLSGEVPYHGHPTLELFKEYCQTSDAAIRKSIFARLEQDLPKMTAEPPKLLPPHAIPRAMIRTCERAMAGTTSRRFKSADEIAKDLGKNTPKRDLTTTALGFLVLISMGIMGVLVAFLVARQESGHATKSTSDSLRRSHPPAPVYRVPSVPITSDLGWSLRRMEPVATVTTVAWSLDGNFLAYGTSEGELRICNANDLSTSAVTIGHSGMVTAIRWHPDGQQVMSCSTDNTIGIWRRDGHLLRTIRVNVRDVAWHPAGDKIGAVDENGDAFVLDSAGVERSRFRVDPYYSSRVLWDWAGKRLATCGGDKRIHIWSSDGTPIGQTDENPNGTLDIALSRDGLFISAGHVAAYDETTGTVGDWKRIPIAVPSIGVDWNRDGNYFVQPTEDGKAIIGRAGKNALGSLAIDTLAQIQCDDTVTTLWHPQLDRLIIAGESALEVWEFDSETLSTKKLASLKVRQSARVSAVHWHPHIPLLAVGLSSGAIEFRDSTGKLTAHLAGHADGVARIQWSPLGDYLASGGADKSVKFWTTNGALVGSFNDFATPISKISWSPDGKWLATAEISSHAVRLYHPKRGMEKSFENTGHVYSLAWNNTGSHLAVGLERLCGIQIWSKETSFRTFSLFSGRFGLRDNVKCIEYCPGADHELLGGVASYGTFAIIDTRTGQLVPLQRPAPEIHSGTLAFVKWSPNGTRLVTAGSDGIVGLWNSDGRYIGSLSVNSTICEVEWSPDSRWLAAGDAAGSVSMWDFNGDPGIRWSAGSGAITTLDWDSDSRQLAFGSSAGILRIADVSSRKLVTTIGYTNDQVGVELSEEGLPIGGTGQLDKQFLYCVRGPHGDVEHVSPKEFERRLRPEP